LKLPALALSGAPALAAADAASAAVPAAVKISTAPVNWLDGVPADFQGTTWGMPWPQGQVQRGGAFALQGTGGDTPAEPLQSWPLAYWPDGSLKWTAHALPPDAAGRAPQAGYRVTPVAQGASPAGADLVSETPQQILIDTGLLQCTIARGGDILFTSMKRQGREQLSHGRLVLLADSAAGDDDGGAGARTRYQGTIDSVAIEQRGAARAVIKISGTHRAASGASLLPFVLRLVFYRQSDSVRLVHSLVYDADPAQSFIRGIGLRFDVPLVAALHDRHVRFVGDNGGVFAEAVRGLSGLRRDPGAAITAAQLAGRATPPLAQFPRRVAELLRYVPAFGNYTLLQTGPDGFSIDKRTKAGSGAVHAASGTRASGTGYLGTPDGGVAFGVRNFWQSYPGQLDIANADTDLASVTLWLWAPGAAAMDLRPYHDGMGQDSFAKQREGLDITYEDYEPGFNSPHGIARTSELQLQLLAGTPSAERLVAISRRIQAPPQLLAGSQLLYQAGVFSQLWSPAPSTEISAAAATLDQKLAWTFDYYRDQVAAHKWYGFWDYGDVMHTFDATRHVWRYDVGGFAWDNSELSTEIWLWHYYLRTGRADVYRMAEAMTRHTSEVDVHHIGRFAPLGSRHDVQHWGDSAKQPRVSTVVNRRFMYYLTADERLGDLLREQNHAVDRLQQILPGRKIGQTFPSVDPEHHASVAFGTDWGAVAAAWFTEWERSGDTAYRDKLINSMASIAAQPHGFFTAIGVMDIRTGSFARDTSGAVSATHLSSVFGLAEICSELLRNVPLPAFRQAWLDYCVLYSATAEQQQAALGHDLGKLNLMQGHARLLAYAGAQQQDPLLLSQAWRQFFAGGAGITYRDMKSQRVRVPQVLADIDEAPALSTNAVAMWGLGAIAMLALVPAPLQEGR
jgi:hypothetical protein